MSTKYKRTIVVMILVAAAFFAQAQVFSLKGGFGAGVITGPVKIENIDTRFTEVIDGKNINGIEAGFFLKARVGPVYIKPMAMYGFRYGNVTYMNNADGMEETTSFSLHKVEVPLMVGIRFLRVLFIEGGPAYNYIFSATETYGNYNVQVTQGAIGYRVGAGLELGPVILSAHYGGATYGNSGNRATFKEPYKFIFGLGIVFGSASDAVPSAKKDQ